MVASFFFGDEVSKALFIGDVTAARVAFQEQRAVRELVAPWLASEAAGRPGGDRDGPSHDPERAARLLGAASVDGAIGDADAHGELEEEVLRSRSRALRRAAMEGAVRRRAPDELQEAIALAVES